MSSPSLESPTAASGVRELTFGQAINEALREEMRRDPTIFVIGEDVAEAGTPFKVLLGLVDEFGPERVIDSPISEAGITGIGVGAAMTGMRPVVDIMFGDFLTLVMDQLANQAAKVHYMSGGALRVPMVLRTTLGATRRSAAQHSQSLHAWVSHVPGLRVALPATPYDAKGLLKAAIRDDNPVVFFEDKLAYTLRGPVPEEEYVIPLGVADVKRAGTDVTIVATSSMVYVALEAAELLALDGISAEVVDPRTTAPLDTRGPDRVGAQDGARARRRRGSPELRRVGRDRGGDRRRRLPLPGRSGDAARRDGRAGAVLAAARGSDRADRPARRRGRADALPTCLRRDRRWGSRRSA